MASTSKRSNTFRGPTPDVTAVGSLKMLLDYAMAEGSELRLPVFVDLLRKASLELDKAACPPASILPKRSSHQAGRSVS